MTTATEYKNIVEAAASTGTFETLVAAVRAADLVETLSGPGPFTVFAPTDEAFAKLPAGTLESLLTDIPTLSSILTYHVVPGTMMASDVITSSSLPTVNGKALSVSACDVGYCVGSAKIVSTDLVTGNGVIHVID
ncbi:MAG: fasciclin domain-containing protein, partial [Coriobacteriia bacterium]|nr:fasciclin domain-containing protein [Coriobacteriia bacterium]